MLKTRFEKKKREKHQELFEKRLHLSGKHQGKTHKRIELYRKGIYTKKSRCKKHLPFVAGPGIEPGTS